jgi:hypothetical protein
VETERQKREKLDKNNNLKGQSEKKLRIVCVLRGKCVNLQPLNKNDAKEMKNLSLLNGIIIIRLRRVVGSDKTCM